MTKGFLIIPALILVVVAPGTGPSPQTLADFSRFEHSLNREISIVDRDGAVREGVLSAARADDVTLRFQSGDKSFLKSEVASAERLKDGRLDGLIKGAVFGAILGAVTGGLCDTGAGQCFAGAVVTYSAIGFGLDAAFSHREPIYRSPQAPASAKKP